MLRVTKKPLRGAGLALAVLLAAGAALAVPRDPYDGQPLRYSPEKRIVYSIGRDRVDGGGAAAASEEDGDDMSDPTFRIED